MPDTKNLPIVGRWLLDSVDKNPAIKKLDIGPVVDNVETALADDSRTPVAIDDIKPGGKYYSIVKLQIRFEKQRSGDSRWAMGTGWLIEPDVVVTAGHCAFDHTYNFGRAVQVRAYIGYNGKDSVGPGGAQFRKGIKIVTPKEWIASDINRAHDVSMIVLDSKFDDVEPIAFNPTETFVNDLELGVVGYPADKTLHDEPGAQMYEMYKKTTCDLSKTSLNMLEYTISSAAGQSGSPVLIKDTNASIGAHVYGLGTKNSASVIRGEYGNPFNGMKNTINSTDTIATVNKIEYIRVTGAEDSIPGTPAPDEESFWDTLTNVCHIGAKIGSTVLQVGTPFLGPIGAPVAAVAGTALSVIGKLTSGKTEDSFDEALGPPTPTTADYKYHASRAILGEAALQACLKMGPLQTHKYGIFTKMQDRYKETRHLVPKVAKFIAPAIAEPALRIAVGSQASDDAAKSYPALPSTEDALDSTFQPFVNGLLQSVKPEEQQEDFFGFLSGIANTAAKVVSNAGPIIDAVGSIANAIGAATEDSFGPVTGDFSPHVEMLCHRALLGDAALHALMSVPAKDIEQEGFFGDLINTVKNIGGTVIKLAPTVIKTVTPIVQNLMNQGGPAGPAVQRAGKTNQVGDSSSIPEARTEPKQSKQIQLHPQEDGLEFSTP
ncbi:hypothetical protein FGADI_10711 [Fusarium gaditjirri]|uniref:Serine protease n=1 Tax=Fusarium gaditjirri TaxID=282569 RepID=A0A8H4SWT2_9HYPO|nr:hypothetical protein FGADI_10711 [Fusarium gaditjirri]